MSAPFHVGDLLGDPVLGGVRTVAGAGGLERPVGDVHWHTGELSGVGDALVVCDEADVTPPYRLDALIRRAEQFRAAALLVVAGPGRPLLSSVRLADRLQLPVLWIEHADPVQLVQELTAQVRTPELARARAVDRLLRQLSTKRTGQDILRAASAVLAAPLSLVAADGAPILGDPVPLDAQVHLDQPVAQCGAHVLVHPVLDPGVNRVAAWLACPLPRATDQRVDVLAVGLAMTEPFIRSWLSGQRAEADRDAVFQAQLLAEVVAGGDSVSRDVVEGAVSLGWRLQDWHVGLHLLFDDPSRPADRDRVGAHLREALRRQGIHVVTAVNRADGWAMWTSTESEPAPDDARGALRGVRLATAALPREWGVAMGIGRPHRGPGGLAATLAEARDAADLARSHGFRPAVEHSDELGVARLLATWQRSEVTRAFAETALAPLRGSVPLLATLRAYLESGGSVIETAHALGVHRNTVTSRLPQIRERLGIDLDDPSQRLALQVACRALSR